MYGIPRNTPKTCCIAPVPKSYAFVRDQGYIYVLFEGFYLRVTVIVCTEKIVRTLVKGMFINGDVLKNART